MSIGASQARSDVLHLVAAVAHADAAMGRGADHLARALVVEHVQRVVVREHRLVDEDPARAASRRSRTGRG